MKKSDVMAFSFEAGWLSFLRQNERPTQWWVLKLDCGHIVGRFCSPKTEDPPKSVKCEYCSNNQKAILKNYDYTSDSLDFERNQDTGKPK